MAQHPAENYRLFKKEKRRIQVASADRPTEETQIIEVTFSQQQYVVLEKLRAEGQLGKTDAEIIGRVFREFLEQEGL